MRSVVSLTALALALTLAAGSSEGPSDAPSAALTPPAEDGATGAAPAAAPAQDPAAELAALLPELAPGAEITSESVEKGVALPMSIRTGVFGYPEESAQGLGLFGIGKVKTEGGTAFVVASMVAAGAGIYTFYYVHPKAGGGLEAADMGTESREACGENHTWRGAVGDDGGITVYTERWVEACGDDAEGEDKTESMLKMQPDGELVPLAG